MENKTLGDVIPELESLLVWAKAHPELPAPHSVDVAWAPDDESAKEVTAAFCRAVSKSKKYFGSEIFSVRHHLSPIVEMRVISSRSAVCERVVVGTKEVPEQIIPAHTEEVVEWKCGSILAPTESALAE